MNYKISILICWIVLCITGCNPKENKVPIYESKAFECAIAFCEYKSDTIMTADFLITPIVKIENEKDWVVVALIDGNNDSIQFKVSCSPNNTAYIRTAEIILICDNGDTLTLRITQDVMTKFDDIHNTISDQPALAPVR